MLRISTRQETDRLVFKLEGRLVAASVTQASEHWDEVSTGAGAPDLTVDLREVLGVDEEGRHLIARMQRRGARLLVSGCMMRALVAELEEQQMEANPCEGSDR